MVVMDRDDTLKFGMDSSVAIAAGALARGHVVDVCDSVDLVVADATPVARVRALSGVDGGEQPLLGQSTRRREVREYDAVLLRKNPPFDQAYFEMTLLLDLVRDDCLLFNDPRGIRDANEKLAVLNFPTVIPRSLVTRSIPELHHFLEECDGDIVVKPLDGFSGRGVIRVLAADQNRDALLEMATCDGTQLTMAQAYIQGAELGDKRIMLLDGSPLGSFIRRPAPGSLRGNTRAGAILEPSPMTERDELICEIVTPKLRELGIHFAGLDVVGGLLTEINVTSPGGIRELTSISGERVEEHVVDWLEDRITS